MLKIASALLCAAFLAGCATTEQIAAIDNSKCSSYGFTQGTDSFAQCRLTVDAERHERHRAAFAAAANSLNAASQGFYAASRATTQTTCTPFGSTWNCTSY